jgi:putative lipase involved disintegration of autophagic bodies
MKLYELTEDRAPKMKASDASAHYETLKRMLEKGNPNVTQRMVDGAKANADSLWDTELIAKEKRIVDTHGAEWWELVKKQYPIIQRDGDWVVTSKIRSWTENKEWPFQYKAQAVQKVQQLVDWIHQGRKRGYGDKDLDLEKWIDELNSVDKK